jgi:hypothetical protein
MKIRILAVFVILAVIIMPIPSGLSFSSPNISQFYDSASKLSESHLIKGVLYVSQETGFYCSYAAPTMVFKYYGVNTSLHEVLYNSGIGHSLIYINHGFISSYQISSTNSDRNFLATVYGLYYQIWYPNAAAMTDEDRWEEYWDRVKQNISNDIPVITSVDPYTIPYLKEKLNPPNNQTHYAHGFVLVGFNETNETVCYNDPAAGIWNDDVNGTYVYIPKEIFRDAVQNTTATKYLIEIFTDQSNSPPLSKDKIFEMAHERNIRKMRGKLEAYSDLKLPLFPKLGANAVEAFKKNLRIGTARQMYTVFLYGLTDAEQLINIYLPISIEKYNASQYLLENENLSSICKHDSILLQKESNCWKNMTIFVLELSQIGKNNSFIKKLIKSIPITEKMGKELNEITVIEKAIIKSAVKLNC